MAGALLVGCGSQASGEAPAIEEAIAAEGGGPGEGGDIVQRVQALQVYDDRVEIRGNVQIDAGDYDLSEFRVALTWVVEGRSTNENSAIVDIVDDGIRGFVLRSDVVPPSVAFEENEASDARGFAVAYLKAFIDDNGNGQLDCRGSDCPDTLIGASPNTVVIYAERPWPTDGPKLFAFHDDAGVAPQRGWSLARMSPGVGRVPGAAGDVRSAASCEARPFARAWGPEDVISVVVIGDFSTKERCEVRSIWPDVD